MSAAGGDDVAVGIDTPAHLEWISGKEIGIAACPIFSEDADGGSAGAALAENDGVGEHVRATRLWPLVAVNDPSPAGNNHLDGAAARRWRRVYAEQSIDRIRVIGRVLGGGGAGGGIVNQKFGHRPVCAGAGGGQLRKDRA